MQVHLALFLNQRPFLLFSNWHFTITCDILEFLPAPDLIPKSLGVQVGMSGENVWRWQLEFPWEKLEGKGFSSYMVEEEVELFVVGFNFLRLL